MIDNKKELIIVQISDIHVGEAEFVPSLITRCVDEINELKPDIVMITGDLTGMGYKREYDTAKNYLKPIKCKNIIVQPGNHDSRNVGYLHFEDIFGERYKSFDSDDVTIVAADSSEPDLDNGQIGREYYKWIKENYKKNTTTNGLKIFSMHHHLIPIPQTGRERNIVNDAGDVLEVLADCEVDLVLCGHKHVPYIWRVEDMYILTAGTVSSLRLRGKIEPNYNIIYVRDDSIDIFRRFPFDKIEKILGVKRNINKKKLNAEFIKGSSQKV
jgi:3',5'-cyclic AMP phosphodiesterase CpdA